MRKHSMKWAVMMAGAVGALLMSANPAAATTHPFSLEPVAAIIDVGGVEFESPGSGIEECPPGTTSITGSINDTPNPDTVSSTVSFDTPFEEPIFGSYYYLDASGTGSGTDNGSVMTVTYGTINFTIYEYSGPSECEIGDVACDGTATLTIQGSRTNPGSEPWPSFETGDSVTVGTTSGSIQVNGSCPFPINFAVYDGASLSISGHFEQI
jgi:hypothetical protein